jgi:tRNA threonylcarbamoyladenosine biosynthesis protein TsaE
MGLGIHTSYSSEETEALGRAFAESLPAGSSIALFGDLGAGKTTFIRGLTQGIGSIDPRSICSPTFTFLNIYPGDKTIYHFDLYRLPKEEEFLSAGFDEYLTAGGICCFEWAEKIPTLLPKETYRITLTYFGAEGRRIEISGGPR